MNKSYPADLQVGRIANTDAPIIQVDHGWMLETRAATLQEQIFALVERVADLEARLEADA